MLVICSFDATVNIGTEEWPCRTELVPAEHPHIHGSCNGVCRELDEYITKKCSPELQSALLATIAAGQAHVLTLKPQGVPTHHWLLRFHPMPLIWLSLSLSVM